MSLASPEVCNFRLTLTRRRKHGKFGGAELSFLLGEVILKTVRSRFVWSTVLESRYYGQELASLGQFLDF